MLMAMRVAAHVGVQSCNTMEQLIYIYTVYILYHSIIIKINKHTIKVSMICMFTSIISVYNILYRPNIANRYHK